jgi:hypothetical protein
MEYTKLVSEEHFGVGRSLVIVLLLAEHDSSNNEVSSLIKDLHTSGRWPIVVFNAAYEMEEYRNVETHKYGS